MIKNEFIYSLLKNVYYEAINHEYNRLITTPGCVSNVFKVCNINSLQIQNSIISYLVSFSKDIKVLLLL